MSTIPKPPDILDKVVDLVLAYRPKSKKASKAEKKRNKNGKKQGRSLDKPQTTK
jgi:hypothetical protein